MGEILNLPSYYGVSTSCATRLMLAKLILLYSFWTEPWESMLLIISCILRRIPWVGEFTLPISRIFTPILTLEMLTNSLVLTGILVESGICLAPWLGLNMLGIGLTSFLLLDSALQTDRGLNLNNTTTNANLQTGEEDIPMPNANQTLMWLCLLYILCQQYSSVLEIYFFLFKRSMLFYPRRLLEDKTSSLEMGQIDRKSETCYQPVPTTNNNINNFKETLATAKNINFVADCADKDADKDEKSDTAETTSLISSGTSKTVASDDGYIPPAPSTPPPTSTPLQPQMIFASSFQPSLPGAYLDMEIKQKVRSRTSSRTSKTSRDLVMIEEKDSLKRCSQGDQELPANRKSWESFKFSLENENFE